MIWSPNSTAASNWSRFAPGGHTQEHGSTKKSRFTEEKIAYALRQAKSGTAVADVCRQLGVSEATFYVWKVKFAHLGTNELRHLLLSFSLRSTSSSWADSATPA